MTTHLTKFAAALVLAAMAGPAPAGQCGYDLCWGAVGFGPNGAYGWAHSQFSEQEARWAVQDGCGGNCNIIQTFYNSCGAIASGATGGWGWGTGASRVEAEANAMQW